jgi:hypothetical protein
VIGVKIGANGTRWLTQIATLIAFQSTRFFHLTDTCHADRENLDFERRT